MRSAVGALRHPTLTGLPRADGVAAHDLVESGRVVGQVVLEL